MGSGDPRSRASQGRAERCGDGREGPFFRRADGGRGALRGSRDRAISEHPNAALCVERNRSDDERVARCARLHGSRRDREVRRRLPWSLRLAARESWQRRCHLRQSRLGRRPRVDRRKYGDARLQRQRRLERVVRACGESNCGRDRRTRGGQHGPRAPPTPISRDDLGALRAPRRTIHLR